MNLESGASLTINVLFLVLDEYQMLFHFTVDQAKNNCPACVYVSGVVWNGVPVKGVTVKCVIATLKLPCIPLS
jgi:hypothetical protein